jgi:hypothetical protein
VLRLNALVEHLLVFDLVLPTTHNAPQENDVEDLKNGD